MFHHQLFIQGNNKYSDEIHNLLIYNYPSLKYFQFILANSVNEYNIIDLSDIAHEYSLFTVSLLLAYKFLEDNPPYMVIIIIAKMLSITNINLRVNGHMYR